jgi:hypothetical protein
LSVIIQQFDPETGNPKKCYEATNWPGIGEKDSSEVTQSDKSVFFELLKYCIKQNWTSFIALKLIEFFLKNNTTLNAIEVFIALADGRLDYNNFVDLMKYLDENYKPKENLTLEERFYMTYKHNFKLVPFETKCMATGNNIFKKLRTLLEYYIHDKDFKDNGIPRFTVDQLKELLKDCKYSEANNNEPGIVVDSKSKLQIDDILRIFGRLLDVDDSINVAIEQKNKLLQSIKNNAATKNYLNDINDLSFVFSGRINELQQIHNFRTIDQSKLVVINAPGGTGKTTLAQEFGLRLKQDNKIVVMMNGSDIDSKFKEMALKLGIKLNSSNSTVDIIRSLVFEKIIGNDEVLFIFDNIDDNEENVLKYIQSMPVNCSAILTCRNGDKLKHVKNVKFVELNAFTIEEAKFYLQKNLNYSINVEIEELLKLIKSKDATGAEYILPHELKAVVSTFNNNSMTFKKFEVLWNKELKINKEYPGTNILFKQLLKSDWSTWWHGNDAWKILLYCTFLNPDFIQIELLEKRFSEERVNAAIEKLIKHDLISRTTHKTINVEEREFAYIELFNPKF